MRAHRVGDLDGDGKDDIAMSLERADGQHLVYVVYGRATTTSATLADIEAGIGGYVTQGFSRIGAVTGGDLDGDGWADLVIGSPQMFYGVANAGLVHIEYSRGPNVFGDDTIEGSVIHGGTGDDGPIGVLQAEDADGDTVVFSLDDARFTLSGSVLLVASGLDFEVTPSIVLPVTLTDGDGLVTLATLTVVVSDVPEAPAFAVDTTTALIPEGAANGRTLLVARAADPEGAAVTYSLVSETHAGLTWRSAFAVDADSGRVYVRDGTWLDYETAPEVTLVVRATDPGGLHDDLTITVTLGDDVVSTQTQTAHFSTEGRSLWDANGSISAHSAWQALPGVDLGSDLDYGDVQIASPLDDTAYDIGGGVSGNIGIELQASFNDGYVSAYLPIDVSITLPDDVALGVPFAIATDWALDDGATLWGETPSIEATVTFDFESIGGLFDGIGGGPASTYVIDDGAFALSFEVEPKTFAGKPFDAFYRGGVDLFAPASGADGAARYWVYDAQHTAAGIAALATSTGMQRLYLGQLLLDPGESVDGFSDADLVVAAYAEDTFLEADLDQTQLLGALGVPNAQVTPWQGTVVLPFISVGKGEVIYDLWSSRFKSAATFGNQLATRVEDVRASIVFEDGTTVEGSLRAGFADITLPVDADLDADGRVSFTLSLDIDARLLRLWSYDATITYLSDLLKGRLYTYMREVDYRTGQLAEDFTLIKNEGFGPVRHSESTLGLFSDLGRGEWQLGGFTTITATGALQVRR